MPIPFLVGAAIAVAGVVGAAVAVSKSGSSSSSSSSSERIEEKCDDDYIKNKIKYQKNKLKNEVNQIADSIFLQPEAAYELSTKISNIAYKESSEINNLKRVMQDLYMSQVKSEREIELNELQKRLKEIDLLLNKVNAQS